MLLSVCVPVHNGAAHLPKALESIRAQTISDFELIVVDDGSSDDSAEIAASFGARVVIQENQGIGGTRKRLVEEAAGDWIAFCDHDDWWEPKRLEIGLAALTNPDTVLLYSGVTHVDLAGNRQIFPISTPPAAPNLDHLVPSAEQIWTSSTLVRREAILQVGNFDPHFRSGEDLLMWFQLASVGRILRITDNLVNMTRRPDSTSSSTMRVRQLEVDLYERVLSRFDVWYPDLEIQDRDRYRRLLSEKLGYSTSLLAGHYDLDGQLQVARELHARARLLNPVSKGIWYRWFRNRIGFPARPPL